MFNDASPLLINLVIIHGFLIYSFQNIFMLPTLYGSSRRRSSTVFFILARIAIGTFIFSIFHAIFWCVFKKCKFISTRTCVFISLSVIFKFFFADFIIFSCIISFIFFIIDILSSINTFFDFRSIIIACICNNCRFQCNRKKGPSTIPARNNWRAFLFAILTKILISVHVLETGQLPFPQIFIRF